MRIGEWEDSWFSFGFLGPTSSLLVCSRLHTGNLLNGNGVHDYLTAVPQLSPTSDSMTATQSMLVINMEQSSLEGLLEAKSWAGNAVMNKRDPVLSLRGLPELDLRVFLTSRRLCYQPSWSWNSTSWGPIRTPSLLLCFGRFKAQSSGLPRDPSILFWLPVNRHYYPRAVWRGANDKLTRLALSIKIFCNDRNALNLCCPIW